MNDYSQGLETAYTIIDMHREIICLREQVEELEEYKRKYFNLLDSSIKHNEEMMGNMVSAIIGKK